MIILTFVKLAYETTSSNMVQVLTQNGQIPASPSKLLNLLL